MRIALALLSFSSLYTTSNAVCAATNDLCASDTTPTANSFACTLSQTCCQCTTMTCDQCTALTLSGDNAAEGVANITGTGDANNSITIRITGTEAGKSIGSLFMDAVRSFQVSGTSGFESGTANLQWNEGNPGILECTGVSSCKSATLTSRNGLGILASGDSSFQGGTANFEWNQKPNAAFSIDCTNNNACNGATINVLMNNGDCFGADPLIINNVNIIGAGAGTGLNLNFGTTDPSCGFHINNFQCGDGSNTDDCAGLTVGWTGALALTVTNCNCNPQSVCATATANNIPDLVSCFAQSNLSKTPTKFPTKFPTELGTKIPTKLTPPTPAPTPAPTAMPVTATPTTAPPTPDPTVNPTPPPECQSRHCSDICSTGSNPCSYGYTEPRFCASYCDHYVTSDVFCGYSGTQPMYCPIQECVSWAYPKTYCCDYPTYCSLYSAFAPVENNDFEMAQVQNDFKPMEPLVSEFGAQYSMSVTWIILAGLVVVLSIVNVVFCMCGFKQKKPKYEKYEAVGVESETEIESQPFNP